MSNITPTDIRFAEIIAGLFFDILRQSGVSMPSTAAYERIRGLCEQLGASIESTAEKKSIEVAQKLQKAVVPAFEKVDKDIAALEARLNKLEENLEWLPEEENESTTGRTD